jgi:hypothetical protein
MDSNHPPCLKGLSPPAYRHSNLSDEIAAYGTSHKGHHQQAHPQEGDERVCSVSSGVILDLFTHSCFLLFTALFPRFSEMRDTCRAYKASFGVEGCGATPERYRA